VWPELIRWGRKGSHLEVRGVGLYLLPEGVFVDGALSWEDGETLRRLVLLAGGVLTGEELKLLGRVGWALGLKAAEELAKAFGVIRKYGGRPEVYLVERKGVPN